jgi:fatty-acyl-CoA synthase
VSPDIPADTAAGIQTGTADGRTDARVGIRAAGPPSEGRPPAGAPSYAHGVGGTPLLGDTVGRNLDRAIAAYPDRHALVDVPSGRRWTYAEFGRAVDEVARGLAAHGVHKGDRVGIWALNCP